MNLKDLLYIYVNRVSEAGNPQNKISVTTNHRRHHADSGLKKSEQDFYCKAISSVMPSNIVILPCCLPDVLSEPKTAPQGEHTLQTIN